MFEDFSKQVEEVTNEVLKGVEIAEKYTSDDAHFALAKLNKKKAASNLKEEMIQLDEMVKIHYDDGSRSSLSKALKLALVRRNLHWKYYFLTGREISPAIRMGRIILKKKEKKKLGTVVLVQVREIGEVEEFKHIIISQLLEQDFRVVTSRRRSYDYVVEANLAKVAEHLKVKGWEKYKFILQFKSLNKVGEKIGALEFVTTQSGRSLAHAFENAVPELRSFVSEKLDELNID